MAKAGDRKRDPLLTQSGSNNIIYNLYKTLLILYHSSNFSEGELVARELLTKKVGKLRAPAALDVLLHLETHQGCTRPELVITLGMSWETAGRVHRSLLDVGLVQKVTKVERRFMYGRHRPVPIFLLIGAPPEASPEAMKRYSELSRKGPAQATLDEAMAALKLSVAPRREGNLIELMPPLIAKGYDLNILEIAAQRLNNEEGYKIWG